jgi:anti-sigma-K factor RskA
MNVMKSLPERGLNEIEMLLPWYATGALNARDTRGIERALARDAGLAEQYAAVEEEYAAIIDLNESLGTPSARAMEKLFASIDEERNDRPSVMFAMASLWGKFSSRVMA